jgi:predicted PhzF superfamily epimerase YddE/YHI9
VRGVVVTAPESDFVSRVFLPAPGIPEDPVTGGYVRTHVRGDRVELSGRAVTVLDGELLA